jgi:uncharacterized protein YaeQ
MEEKFTFQIRSPRLEKKIILFKHDTETREHVVLKLLAYVLFYEPGLKVEVGIGTHYKPDLVVEGDFGVPRLWIECGYLTVKKLEWIARKFQKTRVVVVKGEKNETVMFRKVALKKIGDLPNVRFFYFEAGFVAGLAESLAKNNEFVQWSVTEEAIAVALGESVFESTVHTL